MSDLYVDRRTTIGELLDTKTPPIAVPTWQRNYSWSRTQVECLWLDLLAFSNQYPGAKLDFHEYFLGPVLLAHDGNSQVLLDGQNRIASATILLSVIRDYVARFSGNDAVRVQRSYIRDFEPDSGRATYKLTLNRFDQAFFQREVQDTPIVDSPTPEPPIESHRLIWQARRTLLDRLENSCGGPGNGKACLTSALRVQTVLTDHTVVKASLSEWTAKMRLPVNHPD